MKRLLALVLALCMITSSSIVALALEPEEQVDVGQIMSEIDTYLKNNPSFGTITKANESKTAYIPLSNGETATITITNERVSPSTRGSVDWTDFESGDYVLTYSEDIPSIAKFTHTVDYTLTRNEGLYLSEIEFTDTDISVIPKQNVTINSQDAMITANDTYAAEAEAYFAVTTSVPSFLPNFNLYSYINMSNGGGSDEGIVVHVNSYYSF